MHDRQLNWGKLGVVTQSTVMPSAGNDQTNKAGLMYPRMIIAWTMSFTTTSCMPMRISMANMIALQHQ